eukprot:TRINITY_DN4231_c0_g1_i1.p1 TRINITY_DN4231_c0_g1~~TRINITY_DN4231_c0_g1_i1.p1  ORF type:complete len:318 (+),score=47.26 TRINITY_DN4231_c0_g1_i1:48-956(+)
MASSKNLGTLPQSMNRHSDPVSDVGGSGQEKLQNGASDEYPSYKSKGDVWPFEKILETINSDDERTAKLGLTKFKVAVKVNPNKKNSFVNKYLTASPKAVELFDNWQRWKGKELEVQVIKCFQTLLAFSTKGHLKPSVLGISRHFTNTIALETDRIIKIKLLDLAAPRDLFKIYRLIARSSLILANDLFDKIRWSQQLIDQSMNYMKNQYDKLRRDYSKIVEKNIRTHYVRFVIEFLRHGDNQLIRKVVDDKFCLRPIWSQMTEDPSNLLVEYLPAIIKHIVMNSAIPRKSKLTFFSGPSLP